MARRIRRDRQACQTCRRQKRRCDKALPVCSLCRRSGRDCYYDVNNTQTALFASPCPVAQAVVAKPTPLSSVAYHSSAEVNSPPQSQEPKDLQTGFQSSFFLDYQFFKDRRELITNRSEFVLSPELMRYVKSPAQIRHDVDIFFHSTHIFFPIGKRRSFPFV